MSDLYSGGAPYYARHRRAYPDEVVECVIDGLGMRPGDVVLDLGCGPGRSSLPLARRGLIVHAVDPDPAMLAEGIARSGGEEEPDRIRWIVGSDESLDRLGLPALDGCVIACSYHWMDQEAVLRKLDGMIAPRGGVAVLAGGGSVWSPGSRAPWAGVVREVVESFLGDRRRPGEDTYEAPTVAHEDVLRASAFGDVVTHRFDVAEERTVDEIVGLQLSTSYAAPHLLGDRLEAFVDALRERLVGAGFGGVSSERVELDVIIAKRRG